jgi:DNA-binding IclR family transcriptional regulator
MTKAEERQSATASTSNMLLRGLTVLEAVARSSSRRGVGVTEIAVETALDKSTASRILAFLRDAGYIRQDGYRRYRLTSKLSQLSAGYSDIEDLILVARPYLEELHADFDEEVYLAVLDGGNMHFVDYIPSTRVVRSNLSKSERLVHETAAGRAALALLGREDRLRALALSAAGANIEFSAADLARIERELDDARDRGWAGHDTGDEVTRFAAPIVDGSGVPLAAMCVAGPSFRVDPRSAEFATAVVRAARQTSEDFAGSPAPSAASKS